MSPCLGLARPKISCFVHINTRIVGGHQVRGTDGSWVVSIQREWVLSHVRLLQNAVHPLVCFNAYVNNKNVSSLIVSGRFICVEARWSEKTGFWPTNSASPPGNNSNFPSLWLSLFSSCRLFLTLFKEKMQEAVLFMLPPRPDLRYATEMFGVQICLTAAVVHFRVSHIYIYRVSLHLKKWL